MRLEIDVRLALGEFRLAVACAIEEPLAGVFGASGAGKTTLLHLIAGLAGGGTGRIALNGRPLFDSGAGVLLSPHRRRVGLVFQSSRLVPHYSVEGNLRYGEKLTPRGERAVGFDETVDRLRLGHLLGRRAKGLSGGEARRVALGRALLASPRLLLLDEPLTGLDKALRREVLAFLREIHTRTGMPMLVVSHEMEEVLNLTEHLLVMDHGQGLGFGSYFELIANPSALQVIRSRGLTNVVRAIVRRSDLENGISFCEPLPRGNGQPADSEPLLLKAPLAECPDGSEVHLALRPEDIALARQPVSGTTIQNQIAGRVLSLIRSVERPLCLVDAGARMVVDLTHESARELALREGERVWCLFKTERLNYV